MPKYLAVLVAGVAIAFVATGTVQHSLAGAATRQGTDTTAIANQILAGASAVAPDPVLLLQRRPSPRLRQWRAPGPGPDRALC